MSNAAMIIVPTDITELALLVSKAKASVFTLEYISQFEPADIDSDDVDLRFEVDDMDTGTNVSIVDECGQAAKVIGALVEALEKAQQLATQQGNIACALFDEVTAQRQRIAELEESHAQVIQSRDHYQRMSEEGLKQLAESRTVTLKLLKDHVDDADLFGWGVVVVPLEALKESCADAGVTVEIADAVIKVEAE